MKTILLNALIVALLLLMPTLNFAQAPSLGATSPFSIFTAVGAISILGSSINWGDVGTNAGAYYKATSSTIYGYIHNADSTSAQAALDVATAYSNLAGRTCDLTIAGTNSLGTLRKILGPDTVFCFNEAQTLDGDLTLDGKGNPNAIFIIKIDGALTTNTLSRVLLINSASFYNVFWQVNGAVDLGINSIFRGTIVANGAISMLYNAVLDGRALSKAGAITQDNNMVKGGDAPSPLPILLMNFTAKILDDKVHLNWATASEINNDFFLVQRSKDGIIFEDILRVNGSGNSSIISRYSAIDYQPFDGSSIYRLKHTDFDGTFYYSNFVSINFKKIGDINIYPNPFNTYTTISLSDVSHLFKCEVRVYNVFGEEVIKKSINKLITILESDKLLPGVYFYTITNNMEIVHSGRLIFNR